MKKQTNIIGLAVLLICFAANLAMGQYEKSTEDFKVGDRVEGNTGTWHKCTVIEHDVQAHGYTLRCDNRPLEVYSFDLWHIRAMQTPDTDGGKAADEAKQTTEQAIAQCSGKPLVDVKTKGRAASAALFSDVIRSMFDREPQKGENKRVTKIESIEVGKSYWWRPGTDSQLLGRAKTVYPVKVSFKTCNETSVDWTIGEYIKYDYSCRVDETTDGAWACALSGGGTIKSHLIPK